MNKTLKLKKIDNAQINVIIDQLQFFIESKNSDAENQNRLLDIFLTDLLLIDIATELFTKFQNKIFINASKQRTISLKIHESIVLLQVCDLKQSNDRNYYNHTLQQISEKLRQQIVNL